MSFPFSSTVHSVHKTAAHNAVFHTSSCCNHEHEDENLDLSTADFEKSRKEIQRAARAARQWLIDNPAPNTQARYFLPLSDEPYLDLTDELYCRLVNTVKFKTMTKTNFDYLRTINVFYDTQTDSFSTKPDLTAQNIDLIEELPTGEALVKNCEKFLHDFPPPFEPDSEQPVVASEFYSELSAVIEAGSDVKDFLEYDEVKRKREQRRIKPAIKPATDFKVLGDMKKMQHGMKSKRIEDLQLLDFNGTDFKQILDIPPNLKLTDFEYTEFKQVRCIDKSTGEMLTFMVKGKGKHRKFILQATMSKRADRLSMQNIMAKLLSEYRVSKCMRCVQSNSKPLVAFKSKAHSSVSLSNLQSDGSVWHCAWCAAKISERRRIEIAKAMEAHRALLGSNSFVTRTVPHTKYNSLLFLRDGFRKADKYMKGSRKYKKMMLRFMCENNIKAFESTVGHLNGWHLHTHEIFFHDSNAFEGDAVATNPAYVTFLKEFEQAYYELWSVAAVKAGFDMPSRQHGLQVQNGDFAADYVAKWGCEPESKWDVSTELTKAHMKKSRHGYTIWELIRLYRDTDDERLVPIIKEFAHTMHGQQQLIWSKGLKEKYGINDISDEELAEKLDDDGEEIGMLSPVQWKFIVKNDLRAEFFDFAEKGWEVVTDFLHSFEEYPRVFDMGMIPQNS